MPRRLEFARRAEAELATLIVTERHKEQQTRALAAHYLARGSAPGHASLTHCSSR